MFNSEKEAKKFIKDVRIKIYFSMVKPEALIRDLPN